MNSHKNARLTWQGRRLLVERVAETGLAAAANAAGVSLRTARKWLARYEAAGDDGLVDRSARPLRTRNSIDAELAARFIQTCLREWAYARIWANSTERTAWLPAFLAYYNARRPHSALGYRPPASRLLGNNLLKLNTCRDTTASGLA